jgi:glutamate-ammonia-ligase adenylyltransferase
LIADARDMRSLIRRQHPGEGFWDLKHRPGGMVDVDFIAQSLTLRHASRHPSILRRETVGALLAMKEEGLLSTEACEKLCRAGLLWRHLQQMMRLVIADAPDAAGWSEVHRLTLGAGGRLPGFSTLTGLCPRHGEAAAINSGTLFAIDDASA